MNAEVLYPVLYTPATAPPAKLLSLANGTDPSVRRMVICTEDAVSEEDIPQALRHLEATFARMDPASPTRTFVRARNVEVLQRLLDLPYVDRLRGFVIPKATPKGFPMFAEPIRQRSEHFRLMPILEDPRMTDWSFREELRAVLMELDFRDRLDCVRIGGNDLMGAQALRRPNRRLTIYDLVIGHLISDIVNEFRGTGGFTVTAPVFECYEEKYDDLFIDEVTRHIANGLFGQTVIYPRHIRLLLDLYRPAREDVESAEALCSTNDAVVGRNGRMDEKTTHLKWAEQILARAELFGIADPSPAEVIPELATSAAGSYS